MMAWAKRTLVDVVLPMGFGMVLALVVRNEGLVGQAVGLAPAPPIKPAGRLIWDAPDKMLERMPAQYRSFVNDGRLGRIPDFSFAGTREAIAGHGGCLIAYDAPADSARAVGGCGIDACRNILPNAPDYLQCLVDAVGPAGGTIQLGPGHYRSGPVLVRTAKLRLHGSGRETTRLVIAAVDGPAIRVERVGQRSSIHTRLAYAHLGGSRHLELSPSARFEVGQEIVVDAGSVEGRRRLRTHHRIVETTSARRVEVEPPLFAPMSTARVEHAAGTVAGFTIQDLVVAAAEGGPATVGIELVRARDATVNAIGLVGFSLGIRLRDTAFSFVNALEFVPPTGHAALAPVELEGSTYNLIDRVEIAGTVDHLVSTVGPTAANVLRRIETQRTLPRQDLPIAKIRAGYDLKERFAPPAALGQKDSPEAIAGIDRLMWSREAAKTRDGVYPHSLYDAQRMLRAVRPAHRTDLILIPVEDRQRGRGLKVAVPLGTARGRALLGVRLACSSDCGGALKVFGPDRTPIFETEVDAARRWIMIPLTEYVSRLPNEVSRLDLNFVAPPRTLDAVVLDSAFVETVNEPTVWLDAETADRFGEHVLRIRDRAMDGWFGVGDERYAIAASFHSAPRLRDDVRSGRRMDFDGRGRALRAIRGMAATGALTVVAVARARETADGAGTLFAVGSNRDGTRLRFGSDAISYEARGSGCEPVVVRAKGAFDGRRLVVSGRRDPRGRFQDLRIDGESVAMDTSLQACTPAESGTMTVGAADDERGGFDGELWALTVFDSALSDEEITQVECGLANAYGIAPAGCRR